jgi:5-methyltetrahydropteroyltriglutamate--homocysteine methyltransferase
MPTLLPTSVVGSYPQPAWLLDRDALAGLVPRVRMPELWRIGPERLAAAQDDAALLAVRDMERAGIDIVSDGEVRRESYSCSFATALDGVDAARPAVIRNSAGREVQVPRVVGPIRRRGPVEVRHVEFLRAATDHAIKVALPGPFTLAQQVKDDHYGDHDALVMDYAAALGEELRDLEAAGADVIQIDEPWLREDPQAARRIAVAAIDRALEGLTVPTVVHLCFGYAAVVGDEKPSAYPFLEELAACAAAQISIEAAQPGIDLDVLDALAPKTVVLGVIDLGDERVESADAVAARLRAALAHTPPERLVAAPDCGMKYLRRDVAFAKLRALAQGAAIVRAELDGVSR